MEASGMRRVSRAAEPRTAYQEFLWGTRSQNSSFGGAASQKTNLFTFFLQKICPESRVVLCSLIPVCLVTSRHG